MTTNKSDTGSDSFRLELLLDLARQKTGIFDLPDEEIVEPLTLLLADLRSEARLSAQGMPAMHAHLVDLLAMRMRLRDITRRHPEILDEKIRGPLIILGLSRTGTTKLQRCLGATGDFQTLPLWRILNPLPLPGDAPGNDSRLALAEQFVAYIKQAYPRFYAGHPMVASEPDEEALLQELSFASEAACFMTRVPNYQHWLMNRRIEPTYRWLRSVLQLLQWQDERHDPPRPWLLKSPIHLGRLDEIFSVFPDATIVHCHRDLLDAIPSHAALVESMREVYSDRVDSHEAGRYTMAISAQGLRDHAAARPRWLVAGKTFEDIDYAEIVSDIERVVKRIYARIPLPFTAATQSALRQWVAANPRHRHGDFTYDLEHFGLSAEEIREKLSFPIR